MNILVTGGAGYIGSHACCELLDAGHEVVVVDNLCNSKEASLARVQDITGRSLKFHAVDLRSAEALESVFVSESVEAVMHFAGLKAVGESVEQPLAYYENNIFSTIQLCRTMRRFGVQTLVFSSSCTVYGEPALLPVGEESPCRPTDPYGRTKRIIEQMLQDLWRAEPEWRVALLRYANPVGAHASGRIGEDPNGIPNNLMPYISQVAVGRLDKVRVFGNDYETPDGTGVRDYIHVVDLVKGHLKALTRLTASSEGGVEIYNLGTGRGYSVLEMIHAFAEASGRTIPYEIVARRPGDVAALYADPRRAEAELGWRAEHDLRAMCRDTWNWQSRNPNGYE